MHLLAKAVLHLDATTILLSPGAALLRQLVQAALWGTLFVLAVWLLCRLAPRLPAGLRCGLWWLAGLKLLLGFAWPAPIALPLLPASAAATAAGSWLAPPAVAHPPQTLPAVALSPTVKTPRSAAIGGSADRLGSIGALVPIVPALPAPAPRSPAAAALPWWPAAVAALWLAGVLFQVLLTAAELRRVRAFLGRSTPLRDPTVLRLAADLGRALGLGAVELRAAAPGAELAAPLTARALRPVVVLPAAAVERLSGNELAMTLGHELMHVRRRDLLWGWVPAAAARLFFFLPPAALAAREYALAREAACDAAVLRLLGATPASYGRLLVRLGVHGATGRRHGGRLGSAPVAATAGGAATSLQQLKRRLVMLQHHQDQPSDAPSRTFRRALLGVGLLVPLTLAALVPLRIAAGTPAAAASPASSDAANPSGPADSAMMHAPPPDDADAPEPPVPPPPPTPPTPPDEGHPGMRPIPPTPPVPPVPPVPPTPPTPPTTPADGRNSSMIRHGHFHADRDEDRGYRGDPYILLQGKDDVTMSGDVADVERARRWQRQNGGGDLLWTRRGGKEYVIRDAATLHAVREMFRPQAELGARQAELGAQQAELGARQGELGSRQGALGAEQGKLGAAQARLASEEAKLGAAGLGDDHQEEAREKRHDELAQEQVKLAGGMRRLSEQQRELGRQQGELGEQQRQLGARQRDLGREQERVSREAEAKLRELLDRAVANGTAKEVH